MSAVNGVPPELELAKVDDNRFTVAPIGAATARDVVNGVQLMAYSIVAALGGDGATTSNHTVKSAHGLFLKPVLRTAPADVVLDRFYSGRAFGAITATITQNGKPCARVQLLTHADEPDVIRHHDVMPDVASPDDCQPFTASGSGTPGFDIRVVGAPDYETIGHAPQEPSLRLWVRYHAPVATPALNQAVLTNCTGTTLIGTSMLPHAEIGQSQAHRTLSTGVVGHTTAFHDPFAVDQWLLLDQRSVNAGNGRTHGRALVYAADGRLVASYVQDNMIRHFTDGRDHSAKSATVM
ncbi:MAG: acyl-CoA thioesterase [Acidimicrobiia bacterium]